MRAGNILVLGLVALCITGCLTTGVIFNDPTIDSSGQAKIERVELIENTADKLIFDVDYYLSEQLDGYAHIGIYPDSSYWSVNPISARPGNHRSRVTVGLSSTKPVPEHKSTTLRLQVDAYKGSRYIGSLYTRTIHFEKRWPAHKPE